MTKVQEAQKALDEAKRAFVWVVVWWHPLGRCYFLRRLVNFGDAMHSDPSLAHCFDSPAAAYGARERLRARGGYPGGLSVEGMRFEKLLTLRRT